MVDPTLADLGVQLANVGVRTSVAGVLDRIRTAKAKRQDQDTINVLEEIINELLADRSELVQIARGYEQVLEAQQISDEEITYITDSIIPIIETLASGADEPGTASSTTATIELLKPILSVETITVLQLLGFNFKKAIGEPLTDVVSQFVSSVAPTPERKRNSSGKSR